MSTEQGTPNAERLRLISDTAALSLTSRWASGLLPDGRLVVSERNGKGPCFVFPLQGEQPEIHNDAPETSNHSDIKMVADYALKLQEAVKSLIEIAEASIPLCNYCKNKATHGIQDLIMDPKSRYVCDDHKEAAGKGMLRADPDLTGALALIAEYKNLLPA